MKTVNLLKTILLGAIFSISYLGVSAQTTYYWDFGTATTLNATPAGTDANLTVSDITIGNTLGTISGGFVTTTSASSGYTGASGAGNAGNAARVGALNTGASGSAYFEFTVTPAAGYKFSFSSISFGTRSTSTGPAAYSLCSSVDSYATEITSGTITVSGNPWALKSNPGLTFESESAVTFRIYGHSGAGSPANNTINWKIDDLSIVLTASTIGGPATPSLSVAPANLPFGNITQNTTSTAQTFTVSGENLTGNITYAKNGTDADAFTITETAWSAATGGTLSVVFNPTEVKNYTASIVISSTGAQDQTVTLTGAGVLPPVNNPTHYWDFGTSAANPAPSGTIANITVSDISIGNTLGTVATFISTGSASSGYTGASGQYNAGNAARIGALNTGASGSAYFEFTVTPDAGYSIALSAISFGTRSTNTGAAAYSLRSSADNYATEIAGGDITVSGNPWALKSNSELTFATTNNNPVTFRLYGYGGAGSPASGTINWRIDDLSIVLIATAIVPPLHSITAESNNEEYGTVSLENNVITATPTSCLYSYATPAYTVTPAGKAIVTQEGDKFTVTGLEEDVTITINFQVNPDAPAVYTVTLKNKGEIFEELQTVCGEITIPETIPTTDCEGWEFIGWAETSVSETTIAPACYRSGDILTPSGSITLYAVYKLLGEVFTASLTQEEIQENGVSGGYSDRSVSSVSGDWTGQMAITITPTAYLQINTTGTGGAAGSYILSPEFGGIVSTVKITYANNTAANRRFKIANESGDIVLGTSANTVASTGGSVEIANLDKVAQVSRIKITSEGGAVYITGIDVTYEEDVVYDSNPDCTPAIIIEPETSSLDFGEIEIGKTSEEETLTVYGRFLIGDISFDVEGDVDAFPVTETLWQTATGGTLIITFAPAGEKVYNATLTISSQGAAPVVIDLTGTGINPLSLIETSVNEISAYAAGDNIYLNNLPESAKIYVYNVVGQLITSRKAVVVNETVQVTQKGIFVIKIVSGNNIQTVKIINR